MAVSKILTEIMNQPIHFPGFPQIIVTRGYAYQRLKSLGWSESEHGFGSLDYTIFAAPVANEPLTAADEREYWLNQVNEEFRREPEPARKRRRKG